MRKEGEKMKVFKRSETPESNWIETNAKIIEATFSSYSWGTEVSFAKNNSKRRVSLAVEWKLPSGMTVVAKRKFWVFTKSRPFLQENHYITILYNESNLDNFKLKYHL